LRRLFDVAPDAGVILNNVGVYPMRERPQLAAAAMEVIASWSTVESFMLDLYLHFAGGSRSVGADIFLALRSVSAQRAVLKRITRSLSEENRKIFKSISRLVEKRSEPRNLIAHGVWGFSKSLPDALLVADPRDLADMNAAKDDVRRFIALNTYVITEEELRIITRDNEELAGLGFKFKWILEGHPVAERFLEELRNHPAITAADG
jgi:hypothetical protein